MSDYDIKIPRPLFSIEQDINRPNKKGTWETDWDAPYEVVFKLLFGRNVCFVKKHTIEENTHWTDEYLIECLREEFEFEVAERLRSLFNESTFEEG